jgi:glycine cleavage system aminomethyltransferase T
VDFLAKHVPGIRDLPYFHHLQTTLFGRPVMLSRTGYTGERGYEIFCKAADAPLIWDTIVAEGKEMGIMPCSFTALDWLRVESYLLFYPYDNSDMYPMEGEPIGDSLWELGLDFTVSPGKKEFRGAAEHYRCRARSASRSSASSWPARKPPRRRRPLRRRHQGGLRHLRHVFAPHRALHGHRPPRPGLRRGRAQAGAARRQPHLRRHHPHPALRRPGETKRTAKG